MFLELEVDVCVELHVKIYYKAYILFVCEGKEILLSFELDLRLKGCVFY